MSEPEFTRLEIIAGPLRYDRDTGEPVYHYALFWMADYHPGHPEGEHARRERGQHFLAPIPAWAKKLPQEDKRKSA